MSNDASYSDIADPALVATSLRVALRPPRMLAAVRAVAFARRGSTAWTDEDLDIAEACCAALIEAVKQGADEIQAGERRAGR